MDRGAGQALILRRLLPRIRVPAAREPENRPAILSSRYRERMPKELRKYSLLKMKRSSRQKRKKNRKRKKRKIRT